MYLCIYIVCVCIYIYIYIYIIFVNHLSVYCLFIVSIYLYISISIYLSIYLSLSLSLYIYIYIYWTTLEVCCTELCLPRQKFIVGSIHVVINLGLSAGYADNEKKHRISPVLIFLYSESESRIKETWWTFCVMRKLRVKITLLVFCCRELNVFFVF